MHHNISSCHPQNCFCSPPPQNCGWLRAWLILLNLFWN